MADEETQKKWRNLVHEYFAGCTNADPARMTTPSGIGNSVVPGGQTASTGSPLQTKSVVPTGVKVAT